MTKKGIYEIDFLNKRLYAVDRMLESFDEGSETYRMAKELREIYGYLLADAQHDRR